MGDYSSRTMPTRQRSNRRRSILIYGILGMLCFARTLESAPLTDSKESTEHAFLPGLLSKNDAEEKVGNPRENAYKAWMLFIDANAGALPDDNSDSANILRRIKPKSIFVAPNLTACAEGWQDDTMNRCVKDVNIDHQAQKGFLVQRLQALFGSKSHASAHRSPLSSSSSSSSVPSGPFQLNLPLTMSAPANPSRQNFELHDRNHEHSSTTTNSPKIVSQKSSTEAQNIDKPPEALIAVYELNDKESKLFLGNESSEVSTNDRNEDSKKSEISVPIVEFIDNGNKNFTTIVDYKIPIVVDEKRNYTTIADDSSINDDRGTIYDETPVDVSNDNEKSNISPTLVLLLSPTKFPTISTTIDETIAENSRQNKTEKSTIDAIEEIGVETDVTDSIAITSTNDKDSTTDATTIVTDLTSIDDYSTETTENYYGENYEESTENEDEILKHSEAGITVTLPSSLTTVGSRSTLKSTTVRNDKSPTGNSEISSEASVNDDFVRETTLVDFNNSDKTSNSTTISTTTTDESTSTREIPKNPEFDRSIEKTIVDVSNDRKFDDDTTKISEIRSNVSHVDDSSSHDIFASENDGKRETTIFAFPTRSMNDQSDTTTIDSTASTEKSNESLETMMASSTNIAGTFVVRDEPEIDEKSSSFNEKRASTPIKFETTTTKIFQKPQATIPNVYDYETRDYYSRKNPYELIGDDGIPVIRTIDDQLYRPVNEDAADRDFFNAQQQRQRQQSQQHQRDHVRFPNSDFHVRPNYVRFPSEEQNSIHPNDHKDRRAYNRFPQQYNYGRGLMSTRSSYDSENHRKQPYRWISPVWPMDNRNEQSSNNHHRSRFVNDRSRTPLSLRFWTQMPLMRDPSVNYQQTSRTTSENSNYDVSGRMNYYKDPSIDDFNRALADKSLPRAIGG